MKTTLWLPAGLFLHMRMLLSLCRKQSRHPAYNCSMPRVGGFV